MRLQGHSARHWILYLPKFIKEVKVYQQVVYIFTLGKHQRFTRVYPFCPDSHFHGKWTLALINRIFSHALRIPTLFLNRSIITTKKDPIEPEKV